MKNRYWEMIKITNNEFDILNIKVASTQRGRYIYLDIKHDEYTTDDDIADFLGISNDLYQEMLLECGGKKSIVPNGFINSGKYEVYFSELIDITIAIRKLREIMIGILVMKTLIE